MNLKKQNDSDSKKKIHNFMTNMHLDYYKSLKPNSRIYSAKGTDHKKSIHNRSNYSKTSSSSRKKMTRSNVILKAMKVGSIKMNTQEITENVTEVHDAPKPPQVIEPKRKQLINKLQQKGYDTHGKSLRMNLMVKTESKSKRYPYRHKHYKTSDERVLNDFVYQSDDMREDPLQNLFTNMSQSEKDDLFKNMNDDNGITVLDKFV